MRSLVVALAFAVTSSFGAAGSGSGPAAQHASPASLPAAGPFEPHPIDLNKPYRASDYAFIGDAVGDSRVVSLGESIHVTREMPLVRLNLLRYLHENKGFDTIAFEGSLMDAWAAEEHAYRSRAPLRQKTITFDREALFGLWQTPQMQQVLAYALSTQDGPHPLYVTSFDLQAGSVRAYSGSSTDSLKAFLEALRSNDPQLSESQVRLWTRELGPALNCTVIPANDEPARELGQWIDANASSAARNRPAIHVAMLRLIPLMIRNRLQDCRDVQASKLSYAYQMYRDAFNARMVEAMMAITPHLILWAHHSHLHYNSLGLAPPSIGQHLKQKLGNQIYTVGVFALGGAAMDSTLPDKAWGPFVIPALAARTIPSDSRFTAERRLATLSDRDFFVDLRHAPSDWSRPGYSRLEVDGRMPTALSRDFDGAILLHHVTGAEFTFIAPPAQRLIRWAGWVLRNYVAVSLVLVAIIAALMLGVRAAWRALRRKRLRRAGA